jgi:hypothetical protein
MGGSRLWVRRHGDKVKNNKKKKKSPLYTPATKQVYIASRFITEQREKLLMI